MAEPVVANPEGSPLEGAVGLGMERAGCHYFPATIFKGCLK